MTATLCLLVAASFAQADRHTDVAEKLIAAINADEIAAIEQMFDPQMKLVLPQEKAAEFFRGVVQARGKIQRAEKTTRQGQVAKFDLICERGKWDLTLTLDREGKISGLYIATPQPRVAAPERNDIAMQLPFREKWYVFWGGSTEAENYHVNTPNQRRALDLIIRDDQNRSHRGNGKKNADYYCYGKEILAAADGEVITVIDGVPDSSPQSLNPYSAVGNCIILKHHDRLYSVYAHLQPGTPKVRVGDRVTQGAVLGLCGNSGNSSEPHLHFHLQHQPALQDGLGIAPHFSGVEVIRDGKARSEDDYSPIRGDFVRPRGE